MQESKQQTWARIAIGHEGGTLTVTLGGCWELEAGWPDSAGAAIEEVLGGEVTAIVLTADGLGQWDSAILTFLKAFLEAAEARGIPVTRQVPEDLSRLIDLTFAVRRKEGSAHEQKKEGLLEKIGGAVLEIPESFTRVLLFVGDIVIATLRLPVGRSAMRFDDLMDAMYECGVQSLPIVALTNMLFGLILAFVGAVQLTNFGAQIYVAGLVGIGMLRVMGAIMVGVVISGRVGAAYAALIGTMQVNEEVDALETLGISPVEFLVLPRMLALTVMVPILTVFADAMGILGGFAVGVTMLGLTPMEYINATVQMVSYKQGLIGLCYATVFGIIIAIAGCYHGMRCGRSAQAVGKATTTAVVHSIVGIIIATAIITVICNVLNV